MPNTVTISTLREAYRLAYREPSPLTNREIVALWATTRIGLRRGRNVPRHVLDARTNLTVMKMREYAHHFTT